MCVPKFRFRIASSRFARPSRSRLAPECRPIVRCSEMRPNENVIIFPSDARRELDERSLPTLNVPQQRLSEVPLTRTRRIRRLQMCAQTRGAQERARYVYIIRGNARRYGRPRTMRFRRPEPAKISLQIRGNETDIVQWQ